MAENRIIVVDDEAYVATTLASRFRKAGYDVRVANNGQEALDLALQDPPNVLITDFQMPILSGYDMSVKLKADPRTANLPVFMLTARGHRLSAEQLALTNIRQVLSKPFSAIELLAKVQEVCSAGAAATGANQ